MTIRARRFAGTTAAALVLAVSLVSGGSGGVRATPAPTLYFVYAMNCTFTLVDDVGKPVTSIPPGAYQVDVRTPVVFGTLPQPIGMASNDFTACKGVPMFQLTGPGVNVFTTMTAGCQSEVLYTETFQPNSTYVAQDLNQPALAQASFTTLASGTPTAPVATYGGGNGVSESSTDIVGSLNLQGTLHATAGANGTATLTNNGKSVSSLKAGLYKFAISVLDPKGSFIILGPTSHAPMILAGPSSKRMHSRTIRLTPGRWTYYATVKTVRYFNVT